MRLLLVVCVVITCAFCFGEDEDPYGDLPLEQRIACYDTGVYISYNHTLVKRFKEIINQLSNKYIENTTNIYIQTDFIKSYMVTNSNVRETCLNIMAGINNLKLDKSSEDPYEYYPMICVYAVLRETGKTHEETLFLMQDALNHEGYDYINRLMKTAEAKAKRRVKNE